MRVLKPVRKRVVTFYGDEARSMLDVFTAHDLVAYARTLDIPGAAYMRKADLMECILARCGKDGVEITIALGRHP